MKLRHLRLVERATTAFAKRDAHSAGPKPAPAEASLAEANEFASSEALLGRRPVSTLLGSSALTPHGPSPFGQGGAGAGASTGAQAWNRWHGTAYTVGGIILGAAGVSSCTVITNSKVYREWDAEASRLYDGSLAGVARYAKAWSARVFEGLPAPGKALWAGRAALGTGPVPAPQHYQQLGPHFIADAAALAAPAVVNISVKGASAAGSCGSGFVLDADGTILTNAHVVADAGVKTGRDAGPVRPLPVHITLQDGRVFEGRVVACDRVSDLATVKIEAGPGLPVARLGSSAGLRVGEWVVALGSPLHLHNSVTAGIVSCTDRKAADLGLSGESAEYIQTDAAVNSGNSGGPLINLAGEVVGISSMKAVTAHGVSFAIPIDAAKAVLKQLAESGRVVRPYIGIKMLQLSAATAAQLRARDPAFPPVRAGILVPQVAAGSPAARAGLRAGDVIVGYGGKDEAVSVKGLVAALAAHVGAPLELRVRRHGAPGPVALNVLAEEAPPA